MAPARSATAALLLGAAAGCGVGAEQAATLSSITPAVAYNDTALPAEVHGMGFRPAYRFDTSSGSAGIDVDGFSATLIAGLSAEDGGQTGGGTSGSYPLGNVVWESDTILGATIPAQVPEGYYDLVVRDPAGRTSREPMAFHSLGHDMTPPSVTVESPVDGSSAGAGATVTVVVSANDGVGQITKLQVIVATTTTTLPTPDCPVTGGGTASCTFTVVAPTPASYDDSLTVVAVATDVMGLTSAQVATVSLLPAPLPTGISPAESSTLGGVSVVISGSNFVSGLTGVDFDSQAGTVYYVTPTSLVAITPPHVPGPSVITVTTAGATATLDALFKFVAPPEVRAIDPTSGPATGYIPITIVGQNFTSTTQITFNGLGGAPLLCPTVVNANRIQGLAPPGAGSEAVVAYDPVGEALPYGTVLFDYLGADAGPSDAAATDAAPAPPDGGCPGSSPP